MLRARFQLCLVGLFVLAMGTTVSCRRKMFAPRGDAAAVVVMAPKADAAAMPPIAEKEPNDSPAQAQLLVFDPEWPVLSLEGTLGSSGNDVSKDVDVFKLPVPAARQPPGTTVVAPDSIDGGDPRQLARKLWVEVAAVAGAGVSLQLLDQASQPMETVSVDPGATAGMPNMAVLPGGTYYLRVRMLTGKRSNETRDKSDRDAGAARPACRYRLSVQLGDFDIADEREPDDDMESAVPVVGSGITDMSGLHGWQRDQDYYRVPAPVVASSVDVDLDAVEGVSAGLVVLSDSGARLAAAKGHRGERLALRNVSVPAVAADAGAGTGRFFYVVVTSEYGQNRSQRYVVHIAMGAPRPDMESEPNDTPEQATTMGDGVRTGLLPVGDVDYFRYQSATAGEATVEVSFPAHVRGRLTIIRPGDGKTLASAEAKKSRQTLTLSKIPNAGGPLLLKLSPARGDGNAFDSYTIRATSTASGPPAAPPSIPKTSSSNSSSALNAKAKVAD